MGHSFGNISNKKLNTCEEDLQKIMRLAISMSNVDFGISEGHRPIERQKELYDKGLSTIDGINRKGKHNYSPSQACDIYIYHHDPKIRRKIAYDLKHLSYVAGHVHAAAIELLQKGEIKSKIRWGLNWDSDGVLVIDQSFNDGPHFEIKPV